ncbi:ATPase Cu transporting protein 7A [Bulinus truncatus]|nr:ATPase Cu transporting protein 7A [Bulinus truncatus]
MDEQEVTVSVEGMTCMSCVRNIEGNISKLPGVRSISVSLENKSAKLVITPSVISPEEAASAIDDMGFDARVMTSPPSDQSVTSLRIEGMTCQACVKNIEGNISTKPGIIHIAVKLADHLAEVTFKPSVTSPLEIAEKIQNMGFDTFVLNEERSSQVSPTLGPYNVLATVVNIQGMTCHSCVNNIESNIGKHPSVVSIKVSLADQTGTIQYYPSQITPEHLCELINDMGFDASTTASTVKTIDRSVSQYEIKASPTQESSKPEVDGDLEKIFLKISGMTCASCVATIEKNVSKMEGVNKILVSLMAQRAEVTYDPAYVLPSQIANKVEDLGFTASVIQGETTGPGTCELTILGMTCSSCVSRIESEVKKKRGVLSASVALATNTGKFTFDSELTGPRNLIESIQVIYQP